MVANTVLSTQFQSEVRLTRGLPFKFVVGIKGCSVRVVLPPRALFPLEFEFISGSRRFAIDAARISIFLVEELIESIPLVGRIVVKGPKTGGNVLEGFRGRLR